MTKSELKAVIRECIYETVDAAKLDKFKNDIKKMVETANTKFGIKCKFNDFNTSKTGTIKIYSVSLNDKSYDECMKIGSYFCENFEKICNRYNLDWDANESYIDNKFCNGSIIVK